MSTLNRVRIQEVPWFSRLEWVEVYNAIFNKKYENWVEAYKHLCVWKIRINKLPVGIESTIPLLHAKIAMADKSMDISMKTPILHLALLRFVTIVTKGYEYRYLMGKKMHDLAEKMKLPHYLIDLRNQIIHSDNIFGSTETYSIAVNVCFQWIQTNYWNVEERKHRSKRQVSTKTIKFKKPSVQKTNNKKMSSSKLRLLLENRLSRFITNCGKLDESLKEKKLEKALNIELIAYSANEPEDAMNILVADLFLSPKMISWLNKKKNSGTDDKCQCKSHSENKVIRYFGPHILVILEIGGINIFVNSLIGNGSDSDSALIRKCWLNFFIKMSIEGTKARKIFFKSNGMNVWKYKHAFKWKQHVFTLFSIGENWTIELANLILQENLVKVNSDTMDMIKSLVKLYKGGLVELKAPNKDQPLLKSKIVDSCKSFFTLGNLINDSQKVSKSAFEYVNEICCHLKENCEDKIEGKKVYLGVLPHQVGDPSLYKKLILPEVN